MLLKLNTKNRFIPSNQLSIFKSVPIENDFKLYFCNLEKQFLKGIGERRR